MLVSLIVAFVSSLITIWSIVELSKIKGWFVSEFDLQGVQKFHKEPVARIGGLPIFIAWSIVVFLMDDQSGLIFKIWLSSLPVFIVGLYEDLSARVSPLVRLISAFSSIGIAFFWLDIGIFSLIHLTYLFIPLVFFFVIACLSFGLWGIVFLSCSLTTNVVYVVPLNMLMAAVFYQLLRKYREK